MTDFHCIPVLQPFRPPWPQRSVKAGVSGKEFLTVVALAQDLIIRLALATRIGPIQSGRYNLFKIFPPTGAVGRLLGLNEKQMVNAMGIAFTQMVGDGQSALEGAMTHYLQQGVVAQSAVECALLAQRGITGSANVLEGRNGLFSAYEPNPNIGALTEDLGRSFKGTEIAIKFYSSCRATHEAIDLAKDLSLEADLIPEKIDRIDIRVNDPVYNLTCLNRKSRPTTEVEAQFSLPYCVAAAIIRGDVFVAELKEKVFTDPEITSLAERVHPIVDPECQTDLVIGSCVMDIRTGDGRRLSRKTEFPRGNPKNPVGWEDCVEKFNKCVSYSAKPFSKDQTQEIIRFVNRLEQVTDVAPLAKLLVADA